MKLEHNTRYRSLDYGTTALAILVLSVGLAAVVYGMSIIPFDLLNFPAWIFGPLGVYTIFYSFVAGKDPIYYLVWGAVMSAVAITSAFYKVTSVFVVFGVLMIVIAIIGMFVYWRSKR